MSPLRTDAGSRSSGRTFAGTSILDRSRSRTESSGLTETAASKANIFAANSNCSASRAASRATRSTSRSRRSDGGLTGAATSAKASVTARYAVAALRMGGDPACNRSIKAWRSLGSRTPRAWSIACSSNSSGNVVSVTALIPLHRARELRAI